jgi:hypothetical protein
MVKTAIVRKHLLSKLHWNITRHQDVRETCEDDVTEHKQVTNQVARKFITVLWLYFLQEGNKGSPISALETCTDFI